MMKTTHVILLFLLPFFTVSLKGDTTNESSTRILPFTHQKNSTSKEPQLSVNNRPLTKINGKIISLFDVIKKMNLFLFDYDPKYSPSTMELYQFYSARWQATLDDMIANELMLLDAEQKEIKVSPGEIREELQRRFGPNIHENLENLQIEYEEVLDIIKSDLIINQLIGTKVHAKAFQKITPEVIKKSYSAYLKDNPQKEDWKYQVFSVRGQNQKACKDIAEKAYNLLTIEKLSMEEVKDKIKEESISIKVSENFSVQSDKISQAHFKVVNNLKSGAISQPISQISRFDNSVVMRIFHLKEARMILPSKFEEMHDELKNQLLHKTFDEEKELYLKYLKSRFGYNSHNIKYALPESYQPFLLY